MIYAFTIPNPCIEKTKQRQQRDTHKIRLQKEKCTNTEKNSLLRAFGSSVSD